MNKIIILFLTLLAVACSKTNNIFPAPISTVSSISPIVLSPPTTLSYTDKPFWSLNVPTQFHKEEDPDFDAFWIDGTDQLVISITKQDFSDTLDEFVTKNIVSMQKSDINISSAKHTEINGLSYGLLNTSKDVLHMFVWLTVKNNNAYSVVCGGGEQGMPDEIWNTCNKILESLEIK